MNKIKFDLDKLLFDRKMKVPDLAGISGVNRNTLYAIKNNAITRVDLKVLQNICDSLQCSLAELVNYRPDQTNGQQSGKIFILSGPSGAGKNTLINAFKRYDLPLRYIPSFTTRPMRNGETQGDPYYFVRLEEFLQMVEQGEFLEYESIHGNYYGTHKKTYEETIRRGTSVLKDIDVNGALNFKRTFPSDVVLIYVRPSKLDDLEGRLRIRGDEESDIKTRLERLQYEESKRKYFDHLIYNDDLDTAVRELYKVIESYGKLN